eukprot:364809-Chlamydomonas_euryale.AAC.30
MTAICAGERGRALVRVLCWLGAAFVVAMRVGGRAAFVLALHRVDWGPLVQRRATLHSVVVVALLLLGPVNMIGRLPDHDGRFDELQVLGRRARSLGGASVRGAVCVAFGGGGARERGLGRLVWRCMMERRPQCWQGSVEEEHVRGGWGVWCGVA